jgi:hypothetical protein
MVANLSLAVPMQAKEAMSIARNHFVSGRLEECVRILRWLNDRHPSYRKPFRVLERIQKSYLLVDENHPLFDTRGLEYIEFYSDYNQVRIYALILAEHLPENLKDDRLLEQQLSEIIKNAIRHGNRGTLTKKIRIWFGHDTLLRMKDRACRIWMSGIILICSGAPPCGIMTWINYSR